MIRNWGNSFNVNEDLSPCRDAGEGFRLESRFSERELDRLDLDDLLDLVSEERILADDFLRSSSFEGRFELE
jgi:hypothetical protein